jgi:Fe-S oxidoreductase
MDLTDPKRLVEYAATLDCIHCGLCLRTCPTYQLTGAEPSSPRGRIYMMRGVAEVSSTRAIRNTPRSSTSASSAATARASARPECASAR